MRRRGGLGWLLAAGAGLWALTRRAAAAIAPMARAASPEERAGLVWAGMLPDVTSPARILSDDSFRAAYHVDVPGTGLAADGVLEVAASILARVLAAYGDF